MTTAEATPTAERASILATYVPRLVQQHHASGSEERLILATGTLVSADISGFTALSERLAAFGHEGAEELTDLLNRCFTDMIAACERRGGDIIKFGGDALLVLFTGERHAQQAAAAMTQMRDIVGGSWSTASVGRVQLGISQGAHSGTIGFSLTDAGHLELLVGGPAVSTTVLCEGNAGRGQILVSAGTAQLLPPSWVGPVDELGTRPLRRRNVSVDTDPSHDDGRTGCTEGLERFLPSALVEQVLAGVPGEHRQVVIAFVNMSGTDDLFERAGADAVHGAAQAFASNVRSVLERHPVHLLASDVYVNGIKLILAAGAPSSTDADEDHMLLALNELFALESPLPIRAGVNRGHVYVGDLGGPTRRTFTVMGDAVNLAARLMQRASPGQIIVSNAVLHQANTRFDVEQLTPFHVKGKTEPIRAAVLGRALDVADDDHIGHVGYVGRAGELEQLDRLASDALDGRGSVVELVGESGIGKSRLARETVARHPELDVHRMRGGQYSRHSPFFVVRQLLRRVFQLEGDDPVDLGEQLVDWASAHAPDLMTWLPLLAIPVGAEVGMTSSVQRLADEFRRSRMIDVTADALDLALGGPTALIADDIDLFDAGSADILRAVARRSAERPWLVLTTRQPGTEALGEQDDDIHVLELEPLTIDDTIELMKAAAAKTDQPSLPDRTFERLAERSGGHPLFALELISARSEGSDHELPESVESLVTTRIDRMPARDRMLLREAAVAGNALEIEVLAAATGRDELRSPERWTSLSSFLVQEEPGRYRFRQSIYRDVAYEGLAYRHRREMHRAIGLALEQRPARSLSGLMPLLSDHFDRARDRERAWRYAAMAGNAARHVFANVDAVTLFERALRNAGDDTTATDDARARVAESIGDVEELMGRFDRAFAAYGRARGWSTTPETDARLQRKVGELRMRQGQLSQALGWLTRADRTVERSGNERTRHLEHAEIARLRAGTLHRQGRHRKSAIEAERAAHIAERTGDRLAMARAFNLVEVTYRTIGNPDASRFSDLALEMYAGSGDLVGEADVLTNRGVRYHFESRWRDAISAYERAQTLRQQAGDVVGEALVANNLGEIRSLQGDHTVAAELFEHAIQAWQSAGFAVGVGYATANLGMTAARAGDPGTGAELLDAATDIFAGLRMTSLVDEMAVRRVECDLLRGNVESAVELATSVDVRLSGADADAQLLTQLLPLLGLAQLRSGDLGTARSTLHRAVAVAELSNDRYALALALFALDECDTTEWIPPSRGDAAAALLELLDAWPPAVVAVTSPARRRT